MKYPSIFVELTQNNWIHNKLASRTFNIWMVLAQLVRKIFGNWLDKDSIILVEGPLFFSG